MLPAAGNLFSNRPAALVEAFRSVYSVLVDELGCQAYVKTIYVGFSRDGQVAAAVHLDSHYPDRFEVALPVVATELVSVAYDAAHLKWPMLPVAIAVTTERDSAIAAVSFIRAVFRGR